MQPGWPRSAPSPLSQNAALSDPGAAAKSSRFPYRMQFRSVVQPVTPVPVSGWSPFSALPATVQSFNSYVPLENEPPVPPTPEPWFFAIRLACAVSRTSIWVPAEQRTPFPRFPLTMQRTSVPCAVPWPAESRIPSVALSSTTQSLRSTSVLPNEPELEPEASTSKPLLQPT